MATKRLPVLSPVELEGFANRLAQSGISKNQQNTIMASLRVAANPEAESPEYGIASLPPERRKIADNSVRQTASAFSFGYNFQVDFEEQQEFNEALQTAQNEGRDKLEWAIVLGLLYFFLFPKENEKSLYESIESAYIQAWQLAIKEHAAKYGCPNARVGNPSGSSLREIKRMAKRDSESIEKTYNEDAQRTLRKLYEANPLGAIAYYLGGMAEWANSRQQQKNLTIGIQNTQAGYQLGLEDFMLNNRIETGFRFAGSPPVCPTCTYLMGLGEVDYDTMASNGAPVHPNCPHYWVSTRVYKIACSSMWNG